ncbi:MAG: nitroreductase family protein [Coriobacteriales bacterium]
METIEAIYSRHSSRSFTDEPVTDWEISLLLKAAQCAPVGHGEYDSLQITVITDREVLVEINEKTRFSSASSPIYNVPLLILVSAKPSALARNMHIASAACVVENMLIAAADMRLQSVFLWGFVERLKNCPELVERLGIETGRLPVCGAGIGHAVDGLERKAPHRIDVSYV